MIARATTLLILSALLIALALPVAAQEAPSIEPSPSSSPVGSSEDAPVASGQTTAPASISSEPTPRQLPVDVPVAEGPVVQAVLFFAPTCGHCHYVITEFLPGLFEETGGQPSITFDQSVLPGEPSFYLMSNGRLQLLLVDVSQPVGSAMFGADSERLGMDRAGVPRLDVQDIYLVGSGDIPDRFPTMVDEGLAGGGIGWPSVPDLDTAIAPFLAEGSVAVVEPDGREDGEDEAVVIPVGDDRGPLDRFGDDPVGNGISVVVLIVLVASLVAAPLLAARGSLPSFPAWFVPVLAIVGIGVAAYLANVETSGSEAVCGPVGDCNAVQESEYAELFGVPIGVLGVIGYLLVGGLWLVSRLASGAVADWAILLIAVGAFGGTLFSAYLTFLEPFVIGATCMWCISSALVMMALLWVSAGPAWSAWRRLRGDSDPISPAGIPAST